MLKTLWVDDGGAILSAELILLMTILVIGGIVGLKTLQTAIVTELGDVAQAIGSLNQSFSFTGNSMTGTTGVLNASPLASTAGSFFINAMGPGDTGSTQVAGGAPQGISVADAPIPEA